MKPQRALLLNFLLILLFGCATLFPFHTSLFTERPQNCQEFLNSLDRKVKESGVKNASSFPIPGFPYLRTNRFLSELKKNIRDESEQEQWVRLMQRLDLKARKKEIRNLPEKTILSLLSKDKGEADRERLFSRMESCSNELLSHDAMHVDFYETLYPLVDFPDEYSFVRRAVGLYPLFSIPVAFLTVRSRGSSRSRFTIDLDDIPLKGVLRHIVPDEKVFLNEKEVQVILDESNNNPLYIHVLNEINEKRLIASFAPIFIQDVAASYDRIGKVVWKDGRLSIDLGKPTVYYYTSHAFFKGEPVLQLNYAIWYTETAGKGVPWIERGHLDGLTTRITLDTKGSPFMVDVIKNCGCYQLFAPQKERFLRVLSRRFQPDFLIPQWMPSVPHGKRLGVRVSSGWHQVERLVATEAQSNPIHYELLPYDVLEILPYEGGETKSIFNSKGIIGSTKRGKEEVLLFSMGISSVGSMRQRGRHPCELIGRVHCDDPELFDRYFIFK